MIGRSSVIDKVFPNTQVIKSLILQRNQFFVFSSQIEVVKDYDQFVGNSSGKSKF